MTAIAEAGRFSQAADFGFFVVAADMPKAIFQAHERIAAGQGATKGAPPTRLLRPSQMGEFIAELLWRLLIYLVLLPICWAVSTPVILVVSLFGRAPYGANVRAGYRIVFELWAEVIPHMT